MSGDEKNFGDLVKSRMSDPPSEPDVEPVRLTSRRHDADDFIVALAKQWGSAPDDVLEDFHSNTPLANLMRKILAVDEDADRLIIHDYYLVEGHRARGSTLEQALDRATDDEIAAGRERGGKPITREAIRKGYLRGLKEIDARYRERVRTLADMFSTSAPHHVRRSKGRDK